MSTTSVTSNNLQKMRLQGRSLVRGEASGKLLWADVGLSFWGGVDPLTGTIVDHHHPLMGESMAGRILAIPSGRGSCTGSGIILELLMRGCGPAALVFQHQEEILSLGVIVASTMFNLSIPILLLSPNDFASLREWKTARVDNNVVSRADLTSSIEAEFLVHEENLPTVSLSSKDQDMLVGEHGPAAKSAFEILLKFAELQGASQFIDVSQAHIDACIYTGPSGVEFAQKLLDLGAKFTITTTLNSISIDRRRWQEMGMDPKVSAEAERLADAYMAMGACMSFTCAPYLRDKIPEMGENIGWAESNAVVYANSVLGARTQKYPDFLDVCIALTGRAPLSGCHLEENRKPSLVFKVPHIAEADDLFYPVAGYLIGQLSGPNIPLIIGLENASPSVSDLKAFGAAFATTASAAMFHIRGVTPEASKDSMASYQLQLPQPIVLSKRDLLKTYKQLNTAKSGTIDLISLGSPHFSLSELSTLTSLISAIPLNSPSRTVIPLTITTSRQIYSQATHTDCIKILEDFGATIVTDTCWCMLTEPVVPIGSKTIMTNSAKYAHYAPGLVNRSVVLGGLKECVDVAVGRIDVSMREVPEWLKG